MNENTENVDVHSISSPHFLYPIITANVSTVTLATNVLTSVYNKITR